MLFFGGEPIQFTEFLSFRAVCVSTAIVEKTNQNIFPHTNPYISEDYISRLVYLWFMKSQLKTFDLIVFTLVFTIVR